MIRELPLAPDVVPVPVTEFVMGASEDDKFATDTERPAHRVRFAHRFALGRFPVTVGEYRRFSPAHAPDDPASVPVVDVSWHDAAGYCAWLGDAAGWPYRLPTEAEWECACRAGTTDPFSSGETIAVADANFLYDETGRRVGLGERTRIDAYPPNGLGLHDLHGNVCEWVADAWHPNYAGAPTDGSAWTDEGEPRRVIRGGAWDYLPRLLRSAWRDGLPADAVRDNVGFRVALTLGPKTPNDGEPLRRSASGSEPCA